MSEINPINKLLVYQKTKVKELQYHACKRANCKLVASNKGYYCCNPCKRGDHNHTYSCYLRQEEYRKA